ncbi:MAG: DUF255 domain-containing protein [Methanomicrobiales archaeon]
MTASPGIHLRTGWCIKRAGACSITRISPWTGIRGGDDAFGAARAQDRPIFLSIGYSTCHWCHVMARESFEDAEVAALLNDVFICIKVDREERPDIDAIYMTAAHLLGGRAGWPLTIVMTPDKRPFFAASYIPKENQFGMTGLRDLIPMIREAWATRREELVESGARVLEFIENRMCAGPVPASSRPRISGRCSGSSSHHRSTFQDNRYWSPVRKKGI